MRQLLAGVAVVMLGLLSSGPAYAAGGGQIDHIEVSDDGSVRMLFSVGDESAGTAPDLDSVRVTVDGKPVDATASPVAAGEVSRTAVLALDVSNSMQGSRFEAAKRAALAYLDAAPEDVAIGLVTFAGSVTPVEPPTTDHARLADEIAALRLSAGTLLYDGVLESIAQLETDGQRQVVVLSDGADTGDTSLADVVAGARESGVTVDVVALAQNAANQQKLRQITAATGGTVLPADEPDALTALFTREAEALARQVLVEFRSPVSGEATVSAALDAAGQSYTDSAFAVLSRPGSTTHRSTGPLPAEAMPAWVDGKVLAGGLAAVAIGLGLLVAAALTSRSEAKTNPGLRHLDRYATAAQASSTFAPASGLRPQVNVRDSAVAVAEKVVQQGGLETRITQRLTAAGMHITAAEWLLFRAGAVIGAAFIAFLVGGGNPLLGVLSLGIGVFAPWLFLRVKESRRLKNFGSQLPDTLQLMSGGLSAGLSLPQSVDTVVREGTEPMAGELRRALVEQRLGVDIEDALDGVADRMQSKDFSWVVMAVRIQREIGGNLAELLDTVASTIREREYLRRQVRTLSAEGRLSAWILGGLPPLFVVYLALTRPEYLAPMYTTALGMLMSAVGVVMMGIGIVWLKASVKVEV